jgi:molybdopterin-guanine dinucleotide biosynthesis protein A
MGRDKAMIELHGETFLRRCVVAVRTVAESIVIVADRPERFRLAGCRVVGDLYPGAGPVGAIITGLLALGDGSHIVVACDMPFLQGDLLKLLLDRSADDVDAVVPLVAGRPEPLCAVYRHTAIAPLQERLRGGERAAHRALDAIRTRYVDEAELRGVDPHLLSFVNINTPADAARWLALGGTETD